MWYWWRELGVTAVTSLGLRASNDLHVALVWGRPSSVCRPHCILGFRSSWFLLLCGLFHHCPLPQGWRRPHSFYLVYSYFYTCLTLQVHSRSVEFLVFLIFSFLLYKVRSEYILYSLLYSFSLLRALEGIGFVPSLLLPLVTPRRGSCV